MTWKVSPPNLFGLGHTMEILDMDDEEDEMMSLIVQVKENGKEGKVPLCDLEVTPKTNRNYWPVREYAQWFANH